MIFRWIRGGGDRASPPDREQVATAPEIKVRKYQAGETIGGVYRVLRTFEGGLGVVYAVEHKTGDRLILKTLKRQQSERSNQQFRKEAQTWVQLGVHANIVKAFWVDEIAGHLYVAAELIEPDELGRLSLRDYLHFGPAPPVLIARWTAHFCYGLSHAATRGLTAHRDIKPENLLIGATGILRITDFGLASASLAADATTKSSSRLGLWHTNDGAAAGTPPYMAPEQILGRPNQDVRTDIYSFGVVLSEMAYGQLPFNGSDYADFFRQHVHSKPRIPPGPFASVIERCLAKEPGDRYPTVEALLLDLGRVSKAHKIALPPRPEPINAELEELRVQAHALAAIGKSDEAIVFARELVKRAPREPSNWTQLGRLLLERGDLRAAEEATSRSLALDETSSAAWNNLGVLLNRQGKFREAAEAFECALHCDPQNTGAILNAAEPLRKIGKSEEAVRRLRCATKIAPDKFAIWTNLASLYVYLDDRKNALECFGRARDLAPPRYREEIERCIRSARDLPENP